MYSLASLYSHPALFLSKSNLFCLKTPFGKENGFGFLFNISFNGELLSKSCLYEWLTVPHWSLHNIAQRDGFITISFQ